MSLKALSHIWEHSKQKGAALLLLLAVADLANDQGDCFPGVEYLAARARVDERSAQRTLKKLVKAGELIIFKNQGYPTAHGKTNLYRIVLTTVETAMALPLPVYENKRKRAHRGGQSVTPITQGAVKVSPLGVVETPDDPLVEPSAERQPKEKEIDHAPDSFSISDSQGTPAIIQTLIAQTPITDLQTLPDEDQEAEEIRIAGAEAVKARLNAEIAAINQLDSVPQPFHIANGFGMVGFANPYWEAYTSGGEGKRYLLEKRVPSNAAEIAAQFEAEGAIPEEVEIAVRERLRVREADTRYTFEFALRDWRKWKASRQAPPERDPALVAGVQAGWRYAAGSDASNKFVDFLAGDLRGDLRRQDWGQFQLRDNPMTAVELTRFIGWYKAQNTNRATPPETAKTLRERIDAFRAIRTFEANTPPVSLKLLTPTNRPQEEQPAEAKRQALEAARRELHAAGVLV